MNDPFELLGIHLRDKEIRKEFGRWRQSIAEEWGLLCFASGWKNPLLWSHYAERHKGMCLGFDVPQDKLRSVKYRENRLPVGCWSKDDAISPVLWTKFAHWEYESEQRWFVPLQECIIEGKYYFWPFGRDLQLREIVVGSRCSLGRSRIEEHLADMRGRVKLKKAREAFKTFDVVTQGRGLSD